MEEMKPFLTWIVFLQLRLLLIKASSAWSTLAQISCLGLFFSKQKQLASTHGNALKSLLPLITQLTRKTVQVVNVVLGSHHHLKRGDKLATGCTVSSHTK